VDSNGKKTAYNSTYKKLPVQWSNEVLCFVSSFVVADSFVLRNRPSCSRKTLAAMPADHSVKQLRF